MLLLHVSDTHLGAYRPGKLRERELDFYEAFNEVIDIALRERVDAIIHAGDFFDEPRPAPQAYLFAYRALRKLREHDVEFLVVAGQHDQPKTSQLPPLRFLGEMGLLRLLAQDKPESHIVKLKGGELGVVAIPYISPVSIGEHLKSVKPPEAQRRILLAHLLLRELNMPNAHASLAELSADNYNYVALGDYHLKYETVYRGTPVVYPGSTEALDVLEASSDKYVTLVDFSKREAIVNWVKLNTPRKWIVIEARNYIDVLIGIGKAKLETFSKPPILHLILKTKQSDVEAKRIRNYLSKLSEEKKVLILKVVVEEEESRGEALRSSIVEDSSSMQTPTLDQVVYNVLGDREIAELVLVILRSSESKEEVKLLIERVLGDEELIGKIKRLVGEK